MVFWRGFGGIGFVIMVLFGFGGMFIGTQLNMTQLWVGIGIFLGGVVSFAVGWWLNVANPQKKADEWAAARKQQLDHLVQTGQFQLAPGAPMPSSLAEANTQATQLLDVERAQAHRQLRNIHTLYFIPLQWAGLLGGVIGLIVAAFGVLPS